MGNTQIDVSGIERSIGNLQGEVASLGRASAAGFKGVNQRLDGINGRVREVEKDSALRVTVPNCEKIRDACEVARGAVKRLFWLPIAVGVVSAVVAVVIAKIF